MIFYCKVVTLVLASLVLSFAYLLPVTAVVVFFSGDMAHSMILLQYFLPLWGYIMVYAALGIAISGAEWTRTILIQTLNLTSKFRSCNKKGKNKVLTFAGDSYIIQNKAI